MHKYTFSVGSHYRADSDKVFIEFSLESPEELPLEKVRTIVERWIETTYVGKYLWREMSGIITWITIADYKGIKSLIQFAESNGVHGLVIKKATNALGDYTERVFFS